jgi:SAM-dependent methyltransferase
VATDDVASGADDGGRLPRPSPPPGAEADGDVASEACLSVIIATFDVVASIEAVLEHALAPRCTAEVVVVDGGSTDGTLEILRQLDDPRVRVIEQGWNPGRGANLRRGLLEVTQPYVLVQDADVVYGPDDYERILDPLVRGHADAVFGSRFTSGPHRVLTWTHSITNRALTLVSDAVTDLSLTDVATGLKAFRRDALLELELEQDRFGFEFEVTAKAATAGWRIFEVGISFGGREQGPPRTFRWFEVLRALYCIGRYSGIGSRIANPRLHASSAAATFDDAEASLAGTLDNLDNASNYAEWIVDLVSPHLEGDIVELGAGHGTMSERLRRLGRLTASDPSPRAAELLAARFADAPDVRVIAADINETMAGASFDGAVMINVLEHIPDDIEALTAIHDGLRPGGVLAVYVPAHEVLYSEFDRLIGHQRRYRRSTLLQALNRSGFEIVDLRYVNLPGMFAWFVIARLLRRTPSRSELLDLFDRLVVPAIRAVEDRWSMPSGTSLLAIARRPDE